MRLSINMAHHLNSIMAAPQLPQAVLEALGAGQWVYARHGKHYIFKREVNGQKQTLVISCSPKAKGHGGGFLMLSKMKQLDAEAGFGTWKIKGGGDAIAFAKADNYPAAPGSKTSGYKKKLPSTCRQEWKNMEDRKD
jgi:hypothetical protein